ncbi:estradiol 17-beta-dehydrogenase 11-like isoform X3 [Daphnia pulex]|uniref:estradiol 17-beta-dehydrogenase 11-like isoform X3 n=1 Tax=Daphnia pulex TaxID=6669 RepID=UPI001EE1436C|nr:estradiol 17-beta-dehydrogenase 11-like isoform X3 [Daphnia pulex]XP_046455182.1 estradiol 17-beta-dehydrogenase 11-like isoform X3 [Daphnia pulex]
MRKIIDLVYDVAMIFYYVIKAILVPWIPIKYRSKDISGQIALVTGAGGGIGRLLAVGLSKEGCKVVCWDVAKQANEETVRLIQKSKGQAYAYQVDLSKREEVYQMAQRVKREVGIVSILVNNAGVVSGKVLLDCSDEQIQRTFDVNVLAHFWTVKSFLPDMIEQDLGHIVTVASLAGLNGTDRLVDYCSSKFAAVGFDESLRTELAVYGRKGIKTTVVCPYLVNTPLFAGAKSKVVPALEPEDVAQAVINSILTDEEVCVVPRYASFLTTLRKMFPVNAQLVAHRALRLGEVMNTFEVAKPKHN